ncbi:MAG: fumarylacetoacetate hydrolase family protein [Pseudomonadota bacterium]
MKLVSYMVAGSASFGAMKDGGIVDLAGRLGPATPSLKAALQSDALAEAASIVAESTPDFAWADVTLLPVIPDPGKILCIGLNYVDHKKETGRPDVEHPTIFTRFADTQVAHRQPIIKPKVSDRLDYEGEMAVIIGKGCRNVTEEDALSYVAGYACYNDGSVRDWQRHTFQFTPGKNFPGTGAFGPYLLTADEVEDYRAFPIQTRLNGEVMQDAKLADLIFPVETLISYISHFTPLAPGDVIVTGTPGGVGDKRKPPVYMTHGDLVEVEIGPLGCLRNPILDEERA